jgi:hypothetical protein
MEKEYTVTVCDVCKDTVYDGEQIFTHIIDGKTYEMCKECNDNFATLMNNENYWVSLNMNNKIRVCPAKDGAESYNSYWSEYGRSIKAGQWQEMQFHSFLKYFSKSFNKIAGSYQEIALPCEIQMLSCDLNKISKEELDKIEKILKK